MMQQDWGQDIIYSKKNMDPHFNYQEQINCQECERKLKIYQIQRKNINRCVDFAIFTYYCFKCRATVFVFKFIKKNEVIINE